MTNRMNRRRYRKRADRRIWVFSELNRDLKPEQPAKVLVTASLEQARREQEARRQAMHEAPADPGERGPESDEVAHG